ncbi:MAG: gamma-glutamyltransferase, partial [Deltaproteobacteria bacterium]
MELKRRAFLLLLVTVAACATTTVPTILPGAVATPEPYAAEAAARVLKEGGNAADAAVCAGFVLAVTHPPAGNLGGGGFLVVHTKDADVVIDARETAPRAAKPDMYLDAAGEPRSEASLVGPLAAGVPGSVAGYLLLHERFGSMPRKRLLAPAIRLAEEGFKVDQGLHEAFASHRDLLARYDETASIFLPGGKVPQPGDRFRQPALARVLRAISESGRDGFYKGWFAKEMQERCSVHGGRITIGDLWTYRAKERKPLRASYRGYDIVTMPPPSSGGVVLLQMLALLEMGGYDAMRPEQRLHLLAEAGRRAFADRARYFGDPDFVDVPVDDLLDRGYLAGRFATIGMTQATPSGAIDGGLEAAPESGETCHFSVVDGAGNAVSCTTTLNGAFGCGLAVSGVLLNNEMDDFTVKPGVPNQFGLVQSEKNAIRPGKRPLSSMTPTIVLKGGRPVLVLGSPGGPTIISTVCQVLSNHLALGMDLPAAVAAPRIHHQWLPDQILHEPLPEEQRRS